MTQSLMNKQVIPETVSSLLEKLEALQLYWPGNRGEMYPAMTKEGSRPRYVGAKDLSAIIEQHKCGSDCQYGKDIGMPEYSCANKCLYDGQQPDIVAELVKALEDDAYAATFQSMAGYRTALIAMVKGVMG